MVTTIGLVIVVVCLMCMYVQKKLKEARTIKTCTLYKSEKCIYSGCTLHKRCSDYRKGLINW